MVKFNKFNVANGTAKVRVFYSLDGRTDGRKVVTIYAKSYAESLKAIFPQNTENKSDSMTDYFETDLVRLFEDHPLYNEARAKVESFTRK